MGNASHDPPDPPPLSDPAPRSAPPDDARLIEEVRALAPELVTDGGIDLERLVARLAAGDNAQRGGRYGLSWMGREAAERETALPASGSLVARPAESSGEPDTRNAIIEGENLAVLRHLRDSHRGRVRCIYIDPPYNTGGDFVFADDFRTGRREYLRLSGQTGSEETEGRLHSRWLSLMHPRLSIARELLEPEGFIAVSIGEEEVPNLRLLMDELFGSANHRNTIALRRHDKNLSRQFMQRGLTSLAVGFEYVLVYARSAAAIMRPVLRPASQRRQRDGYWKGFWNAADRPTMRYDLFGVTPAAGQWKWKESTAREAADSYREYREKHAQRVSLEVYWEETGKSLRFLRRNPAGRGRNLGVEHWVPPSEGILRSSDWTDLLVADSKHRTGVPFDNPKSTTVVGNLLRMLSAPDGIVLDFFAGSGSTAHAVMEVNREMGWEQRFILVQLAESVDTDGFDTIAEMTRDRVRLAAGALGDTAGDTGFRAYRFDPAGGGPVGLPQD